MYFCYFFEDFAKIFDHVVGGEDSTLARVAVDLLHFAKDAPLRGVPSFAKRGMPVFLEEESQRGRIEKGLKSGIEKAGVSQILQSRSDVICLHVETSYITAIRTQ